MAAGYGFAVGLMNPMIALGHVIRNENVGEKLEWPLGIERDMKPAVNIQSDEVAGAGDLRIVSEDEVERKSARARFNQPKKLSLKRLSMIRVAHRSADELGEAGSKDTK